MRKSQVENRAVGSYECRAWYARTVRDRSAGHRGAEQPHTIVMIERFERAPETIHQTIAGNVVGRAALYLITVDVLRDIEEQLIGTEFFHRT